MPTRQRTNKRASTDGAIIPSNYEYLECRSFGHAWQMQDAPRTEPSWGYLAALVCSRCGMERLDTIDLLGQISVRRYLQPEGYRNPDHTDRAEYRIELMHQLTTKRLGTKRGRRK
jgi:hypothetical protein